LPLLLLLHHIIAASPLGAMLELIAVIYIVLLVPMSHENKVF
jgi:hypothetical protein